MGREVLGSRRSVSRYSVGAGGQGVLGSGLEAPEDSGAKERVWESVKSVDWQGLYSRSQLPSASFLIGLNGWWGPIGKGGAAAREGPTPTFLNEWWGPIGKVGAAAREGPTPALLVESQNSLAGASRLAISSTPLRVSQESIRGEEDEGRQAACGRLRPQ